MPDSVMADSPPELRGMMLRLNSPRSRSIGVDSGPPAEQSMATQLLNLEGELLEAKRTLINRNASLRDCCWGKEQADQNVEKLKLECQRLKDRDILLNGQVHDYQQKLHRLENDLRNHQDLAQQSQASLQAERQSNQLRIQALTDEMKILQTEHVQKEKLFREELNHNISQIGLAEKKYLTLQLAYDRIKLHGQEASRQSEQFNLKIQVNTHTHTYTHKHIHTHIYMYTYIYICVLHHIVLPVPLSLPSSVYPSVVCIPPSYTPDMSVCIADCLYG
jgi:predicted  nucleic acid-binding Zn-ribbon protein